jgi:large subunit ribosomal protein L4e
MFNPNQVFRRWHRHVNQNQKRFAVCSALAASALPAIVMARGHQISNVPEFPLVLANKAESVDKTKDAVALLKSVGAYDDVQKAKDSKSLRSGVGKMRNRRYTGRRGPLVIFSQDSGITRGFRNLPGVDLACVERLNLLQLAPGGHLGRFIVWTEDAFKKCNEVFGSETRLSTSKSGFHVPRNVMANSDLTRIINSDEIQGKLRPTRPNVNRKHNRQKKNPLKNFGVMVRLNPFAQVQKRARIKAAKTKSKDPSRKANNKIHAATKKANWARLNA